MYNYNSFITITFMLTDPHFVFFRSKIAYGILFWGEYDKL